MHKSNLERYQSYCQSIECPELYVEFSFYSLIAACLQRRVWFTGGDWPVFANLYLVMVGDPGTGKTNAAKVNINLIKRLGEDPGSKQPLIPVAPDTISVEALIRKLAFGIRLFKLNGQLLAQSPMTFISEELGNLFKKDDQQLTTFLLQGYDCGDFIKELKGTEKVNSVESVSKMCLNFLAATTPAHMQDFTARGLMSDGFLGRAIFLYGGHPKSRKLFFSPTADQNYDLLQVENHCRKLTQIAGQVSLSTEAYNYLEDWLQNHNVPINEDRRLLHYYGRKKINVEKLAIIHHFADQSESFEVQVESVKKALEACARAELDMHLALCAGNAKNPVHGIAEMIIAFLDDRKRKFPTKDDKFKKKLTELQLLFSSEADTNIIQQAVMFLMISGRVKTSTQNGELYYEAITREQNKTT